MSRQSQKRRANRRNFVSHVTETLEPRMLLAGDMVASWQNPVDCNDVNQDGFVTAVDALSVIRQINSGGARALPELASGEPGSLSDLSLIDTNGDGFLTPSDAQQVIEFLNAQGEGEILRFRLEVTDTSGNVITNANIGDEFQVHGYVQDLRDGDEAQGVFAAYVDVNYDSGLASVASDIEFGSSYTNGRTGSTSTPGLLDEVGAFANASPLLSDEFLLFSVTMEADAAGTLNFTSDGADVLPARETLFFGTLDPVQEADIEFGSTQLTIGNVDGGIPDLVQFAKDLDAAGVTFWSTNQANADAVAQRNLFQDGASYLPTSAVFNADGSFTSDATAAGITAANTWVFPGGATATGVLTLEEISTQSGVTIPTADGPSLMEIFGTNDISVEIESPRQLPLDGYDPTGNGLTYTVSVDDPDLVDATVLDEGNRYWSLEIEDYGTMVFEFFEDKAPRATDRFIELTESGFYDGLTIHRVIDGFVIQGGDPNGNGSGGSSLPDFDDQFHIDLQHNQVGILSMAKSSDDTNNSQFFVTDGTPQHLDFNHTVFGQLVEGFDVLEGISEAIVNGSTPASDIIITDATVFNDTENAILTVRAREASGTTSVTVTATDSENNSTSQTFQVTLEPSSRNSQPFLDDIPELTAAVGSTLEFQLGYTDIENDPVFFFASGVSTGDVEVSDTGLVSVDIPADAAVGGTLLLNVAVAPTAVVGNDFDRQQVVVNVVASDAAVDDAFSVDEDTTVNMLDVLANDGLGDDARIVEVFGDPEGLLEISEDGLSLLYSPTSDFFGASNFTYLVATGNGQSATGAVEVMVNNVVDAPVAVDDVFPDDLAVDDSNRGLFVEDSTGILLSEILANDVGPDGEAQESLLYTAVTQPQFGTLMWDAQDITYIPNADFFGTDTFDYTVTGLTSGMSATATVTIHISSINDAPTVGADALTVVGDTTTVIPAATLLANDTVGPENEVNLQFLEIIEATSDSGGTVSITATGDLEYTPADGFQGIETIIYTVTDDGLTGSTNSTAGTADPRTALGALTLTVDGAPLVQDDSFDVVFGSTGNVLDVLANDDQTESLEILSVTDSDNASISVGDGVLEYTPNGDFVGTDTFSYTVRGSNGMEAVASVTVNVSPEASTAVDDDLTIQGSGSLDVLANDVLGAGATTLMISGVEQPGNGFVGIVGSSIEYIADDGFVGSDSFTYTIIDDNNNSSTATVNLTVEGTPNNPPVAFDDDVSVESDGGQQALGVLNNDSVLPDVGETKSVDVILTAPSNGTAVISSDGGDILYTPDAGFTGTDQLEYRLSDGNGGTDTATVDIEVTAPQNIAPIAVDDAFTVVAPGVQTYNVLANDITEAGETLTIVSVDTTGTSGTVEISADGRQILYTPDFGQEGADSFTYTIDDGGQLTDSATVTVDVTSTADSFYAGSVFTDLDNDGVRDEGDRGIAGVSFILEGTTTDGTAVRREAVSDLTGDFRFDGLAPGDYTLTQTQPAFTSDGRNVIFGLDTDVTGQPIDTPDEIEFEVTQQLIASGSNSYGERGLLGQFALVDILSSSRQPGLFVVMDGDELSWVEERGGWDEVTTVDLTMSGDELMLTAGSAETVTLSMSDPADVQLIGRSGTYTFLRINGTSQQVLSATAVDQVFAS